MHDDIPRVATGSAATTATAPKPVTILLASFCGARFIRVQLDSIAAQTYRSWRLIVSDDGSHDETRQIVRDFAMEHTPGQVVLIDGPGQGATRNFLHLIRQAPTGIALAFADQDDQWFPDKLSRAMAAVSIVDGPAHYAARTVIADQDLRPLQDSPLYSRPRCFRNALVQACMAGNCSVFNPAAAMLLKEAVEAAEAADIESHDWWAYLLTSGAGASIIHDPQPALLYRQHGHSEMGRNDTPRAMARRLGLLFSGDYGKWLVSNIRALDGARHLLTPESRQLLDDFNQTIQQSGLAVAFHMRRLGLYRQTRASTAALYSAAVLGRLSQLRSPKSPIR